VLKQFLRHLSEKRLASADDRILLAVSGGLDSMVMLHLFSKAGFGIAVAHCNFQLRGTESDNDEAFVRDWCEKAAISFFCKRFNTEKYANENSLSIQMAARELRYAWFQSVAEHENFHYIATAHHLNDSIETVLFNWINGTSIDGLTGIPVQNNNVIRPLLFAGRAQVEEYARENNLIWREDSSNQSDGYKRNFIRHQIMPRLQELNPSLESTIARGQRKLTGELSFFRQALATWKKEFVVYSSSSISIQKKAFEGIEHPAIILSKVIAGFGFNFDVCEEIMGSLHGQSGAKFISTSHLLVVDRSVLLITPHQTPLRETLIEEGQGNASLATWGMEIKTGSMGGIPASNPLVAMLDAGKLKFPLCWRMWREGDFFYPLGMEHKKKLSDFLIDTKIPLSAKANITVLESDGQLVWVVGHRIDNRFKLTAGTKKAISFSVSQRF
jgi:tRNA(Ile)-lysidine synthase